MTLEATLTVTVTDAATFQFQVENTGDSPVDLQFSSGKQADIAVSADGEERWRWSEGLMFTQALQTRTLAPGETFEQEFVWEAPPDGEYSATATLEANLRQTAETTFSV